MQYIMVKKITNVTHVEKHFLNQEAWINILIWFIMVKKTTNVTYVEKHFLKHGSWRNTLIQFIIIKKTTNVKYVGNFWNEKKTYTTIWNQFIIFNVNQVLILRRAKRRKNMLATNVKKYFYIKNLYCTTWKHYTIQKLDSSSRKILTKGNNNECWIYEDKDSSEITKHIYLWLWLKLVTICIKAISLGRFFLRKNVSALLSFILLLVF